MLTLMQWGGFGWRALKLNIEKESNAWEEQLHSVLFMLWLILMGPQQSKYVSQDQCRIKCYPLATFTKKITFHSLSLDSFPVSARQLFNLDCMMTV